MTNVTLNTEELSLYAKTLRLGHPRNNCSEIIHNVQIEKPSYLDFLISIMKDEVEERQQNELLKRIKAARLPRTCDLDLFDFNHSAGMTKAQL